MYQETIVYTPKFNSVFVSPLVKKLHTQHFAGGQSSLADYCTYFVAYSDGSCTDINSARAPDRMLGEVRGSESRLLLVILLIECCKISADIFCS